MKARDVAIATVAGAGAFVAIALIMRARATEPAFDPWVYDLDGDGVISLHELEVAIADHASDLLPIEHLAKVAAECQERPLPFDPWWYDFNGDGVMSEQEALIAVSDWQRYLITMSELLQVINLWQWPNGVSLMEAKYGQS